METACYIYWANSNYCLDDERNISTMDYGLGCRSRKSYYWSITVQHILNTKSQKKQVFNTYGQAVYKPPHHRGQVGLLRALNVFRYISPFNYSFAYVSVITVASEYQYSFEIYNIHFALFALSIGILPAL